VTWRGASSITMLLSILKKKQYALILAVAANNLKIKNIKKPKQLRKIGVPF
jgi:hypothetical protein